jgi:hypothetical protein
MSALACDRLSVYVILFQKLKQYQVWRRHFEMAFFEMAFIEMAVCWIWKLQQPVVQHVVTLCPVVE